MLSHPFLLMSHINVRSLKKSYTFFYRKKYYVPIENWNFFLEMEADGTNNSGEKKEQKGIQ